MRPSWGTPPLGDVDLRHDLDAGDHGGLDVPGRGHDVVEDPVDAVADPHPALLGLDVDVAGALADGLEDDLVDEADDRRLVHQLAEAVEAHLLVGGPDPDLPDHGLQVLVEGRVLVQGPLEVVQGDDGRHDLVAGVAAHVIQGQDVEGVHHAERELPVGEPEGDDLVAPRHVLGEDQHRLLVREDLGEVQVLQPQLAGHRAGHLRLRGDAHLQEHLPEPLPRPLLALEGLLQPLGCEEPRLDEDLPQPPAPAGGGAAALPVRLRDGVDGVACHGVLASYRRAGAARGRMPLSRRWV